MNLRLIVTSLFKTFLIISIVISPIFIEYYLNFIMNKTIQFDLSRNLQTAALVLLAVGISNFFNTDKVLPPVTRFYLGFYPAILLIMLIFVKTLSSRAFTVGANRESIVKLNSMLFISSLMYYFAINIFLDKIQVKKGNIQHYIISIEFKFLKVLSSYFDSKGPFVKSLVFTSARLFLYMIAAVSITQIVKWIFPYQTNTPNDLTVFAAIWGVMTFTFETFFSNLRRSTK